MMEKFEIQRKIFTVFAVLMLLSAVSLAVVIPRLFQEASTDSILKAGAIATSVAMGLRLLILLAFLYGIRLTKRRRHINKEINLAAGIVLLILGFIVMDGAFSYLDKLLFVSIGMFVCAFCDFAVTVISVAALFLLRSKKKN
jgi:peptidoglycan/LPS O-acetylase OafA/YrhL